ncbi:hypothetical protein MOMA_08131 [Moraxella macacae 0408225]|uniref:Lipoprotein n=1 Tax=Moraxella macacae 0408225 TaxID=1230338 RepID=L2F632_9GAMM|nr:HmuY family protein [Moraxella macacae]ELA08514.1 hypothetical protein MOMA_08131 [Moraxella macacae 0408225]
MQKQLTLLSIALLSTALVACGGGGEGSSNQSSKNNAGKHNTGKHSNGSSTNTGKNTGKFTQSAKWVINTEANSLNAATPKVYCYDFDGKAEVGCDTDTWDLKFDNSGKYVPKLWSNSGVSGDGKGGVFGLLKWSDLKTFTDATLDPKSKHSIVNHYQVDKKGSIFDTQKWYEYNATSHQLSPNNRVYLITTDNTSPTTQSSVQLPIFAVQVINYYSAAGVSGHPTLRWIDTATPNNVKTKTFDASATTQYINLKTGETTTENGDWHIALDRFNVRLNGGTGSKKKVAGFLAKTPAGYYDTNNKPITDKFNKDNKTESLADLTNVAGYKLPTSAKDWVSDKKRSALNAYNNQNPFDLGWYVYSLVNHKLVAKTDDDAQGALLRSSTGDSYARMRLAEIQYKENATSPNAWVFEFDIQPK